MAAALMATGWFILKALPALIASASIGYYLGYKDLGRGATVTALAGMVLFVPVYSLEFLVPQGIFTFSVFGGITMFVFGNIVMFSFLRKVGEQIRKPDRDMLQDYKGWNGHAKQRK